MLLFLTELILCFTHRLWNRRISAILCRAHNDGVINSEQLHRLAAAFDPTQDHQVYGPGRARGFASRGLPKVVRAYDSPRTSLGPAAVDPDTEPSEWMP